MVNASKHLKKLNVMSFLIHPPTKKNQPSLSCKKPTSIFLTPFSFSVRLSPDLPSSRSPWWILPDAHNRSPCLSPPRCLQWALTAPNGFPNTAGDGLPWIFFWGKVFFLGGRLVYVGLTWWWFWGFVVEMFLFNMEIGLKKDFLGFSGLKRKKTTIYLHLWQCM